MSLISYFGGKSSIVFKNFINSKIPKVQIDTYVEPFSGSFATYMDDDSLFFDTVVFNDKNRHQVNLYYCSKYPAQLLSAIDSLLAGELCTNSTDTLAKWDFYKFKYSQWTKDDFLDDMNFEIGDFNRAAKYAFLITSSFSSVYPRGGGFTGYKKEANKLKLSSLIDKLKKGKYQKKLESITHFLNVDFEELIIKFDSESTFFYLDPPYARFNSDKGEDDARRLFWYGSDADDVFGPASHRRLLQLLKTTKSKWALSYYYFPLLEELLPRNEYHWFSKEVDRSSARGGNNAAAKKDTEKGVELLITNYQPL